MKASLKQEGWILQIESVNSKNVEQSEKKETTVSSICDGTKNS